MRALVVVLLLAVWGRVWCGAELCEPNIEALQEALGHNLAHRPRPYDAESLMHEAYVEATHVMDWFTLLMRQAGVKNNLELFFAFYLDSSDTSEPCTSASSGPFVTGGGSALCDMVSSQSSLKQLGTFMDDILKMKSSSDWSSTQSMVKALGYDGYSSFKSARDLNYVYMPSNKKGISGSTHWTVNDLQEHQASTGFYGVSGGGGGGMGWSMSCVDNDKPGSGTVLMTGGGGGGGGMSSPYHTVPTRAGGGGGGGAQSEVGHGFVGAGAGTSGHVQPNPSEQVDHFISNLKSAKDTVISCLKDKSKHIQLRGGGGGGGGFEVFKPWNVTDSTATPEEYTPHAVSYGWGMQFSVAQSGEMDYGRLYSGSSDNGDAFVLCPGVPDGKCSASCFLPSSETPGSAEQVNQAFSCAPRIAAQICSRAMSDTNPPQRYGAYSSYQSCNAPLVTSYLETILPKISSFGYAGYPGYNVPGADPLPEITSACVSAHKSEWCVSPPSGCLPHPAC